MAYRPPVFNLLADVYAHTEYPSGTPRLTDVEAQWRGVGKPTSVYSATAYDYFSVPTEILLPKGTDIRSIWEEATNLYDVIKLYVDGGTLPFRVFDVYDVGKGFTNEYRVAVVVKLRPWPKPIP